MHWQGWSDTLKDVLGLKGSPVAVTYALDAPGRVGSGQYWVCAAWRKARDGATVILTAETSAPPGGTWHLGLGPPPVGESAKALQKFLVEGEKLYCSIAVFYRAMAVHTRTACGVGRTRQASVHWKGLASGPMWFSSSRTPRRPADCCSWPPTGRG